VDRIDAGREFKKGAEMLLDNPLAASGSVDGYSAYFFSRRTILLSAVGSFLVTAAIGLILAVRYDWRILPFGAAGIALGYFYTAPPFRFGYRGLGDLICFIGSGPLPVAGTYFLLSGRVSASSLLGGCVAGLLVDAILYIGNVPDAEADRKVGKKTLSTLLGRGAVRYLAPAYYGTAFAIVAASVAAGIFPPWALLSLAALPIVVLIILRTRRYYDDVPRFAPSIMMTVQAFALGAVLLSCGFLLGRIFS
jgi:1,4-dihydroxy-2-naphthoate octaprenyltransferase